MVVMHGGIPVLLLRPMLLSDRRLSLLLLILANFGVHTWNTPFTYSIPHRLFQMWGSQFCHAQLPAADFQSASSFSILRRLFSAINDKDFNPSPLGLQLYSGHENARPPSPTTESPKSHQPHQQLTKNPPPGFQNGCYSRTGKRSCP